MLKKMYYTSDSHARMSIHLSVGYKRDLTFYKCKNTKIFFISLTTFFLSRQKPHPLLLSHRSHHLSLFSLNATASPSPRDSQQLADCNASPVITSHFDTSTLVPPLEPQSHLIAFTSKWTLQKRLVQIDLTNMTWHIGQSSVYSLNIWHGWREGWRPGRLWGVPGHTFDMTH